MLPGDPVICCPAPPVSLSADSGRFSRPAHHPPQTVTSPVITVANAAATTHRSRSVFGRNGSFTTIANHRQTPNTTTAATTVAVHLTARLNRAHLVPAACHTHPAVAAATVVTMATKNRRLPRSSRPYRGTRTRLP